LAFKVLLHPTAVKELRKLDQVNQARMKKTFSELSADPSNAGKPLRPSDFGVIRSWDYRAIYQIDAKQRQIIVLFIGHRKKMYADFSKLI
jgi:mRNA-degrading endonuclease RelE of RelBE toxin-antitoxin system